jgi:hypothetical protein
MIMKKSMLHVFRNTPFGRETLMQSIYFCKKTETMLKVYIPEHRQFLMYFQNKVITIDLDNSFLRAPETARQHAEEIIRAEKLTPGFLKPKAFTASTLPDIPTQFSFMCCPRSISDLSTKIGLGYIGPKVRNIIENAAFPVLIPTPVYKKWNNITVFFGGSKNAVNAFRLGIQIMEASGCSLSIFTHAKKKPKKYYAETLEANNLFKEVNEGKIEWLFCKKGKFRENLYSIPHDSLVIIGAYGHGLIKELIFGSIMEEAQTILPNNMLIVGPNYTML